jgi:SAM-dependent methyltransferase
MGRIVFERRLGVDTEEIVPLEALGLADRDRVSYTPSDWFTVRSALKALTVRPDDVFIDYGCGKGRVVLMAARYPFKRVIGVDISGALISIAEQNVTKNADRLRCKDIALVKATAEDYEVPDDVTIAYFYKPFTGETFAKVVEQLVASLERRPRQLQVVFTPAGHPWYQVDAFNERARLIRTWNAGSLSDSPGRTPIALYVLESRGGSH